jgi:hypothetical protein
MGIDRTALFVPLVKDNEMVRIVNLLAATRNNLNAALNFLDRTPPDLVKVRDALACAAKDNDRASTVVGRIRAFTQKAPTRPAKRIPTRCASGCKTTAPG